MSNYTTTTTINQPNDAPVAAVREALSDQGLGVLTEIDLKASLKEKLDVAVAPQVILGACRPPLAYKATQAGTSIAAVLPCKRCGSRTGARTTRYWSRRSTPTQ